MPIDMDALAGKAAAVEVAFQHAAYPENPEWARWSNPLGMISTYGPGMLVSAVCEVYRDRDNPDQPYLIKPDDSDARKEHGAMHRRLNEFGSTLYHLQQVTNLSRGYARKEEGEDIGPPATDGHNMLLELVTPYGRRLPLLSLKDGLDAYEEASKKYTLTSNHPTVVEGQAMTAAFFKELGPAVDGLLEAIGKIPAQDYSAAVVQAIAERYPNYHEAFGALVTNFNDFTRTHAVTETFGGRDGTTSLTMSVGGSPQERMARDSLVRINDGLVAYMTAMRGAYEVATGGLDAMTGMYLNQPLAPLNREGKPTRLRDGSGRTITNGTALRSGHQLVAEADKVLRDHGDLRFVPTGDIRQKTPGDTAPYDIPAARRGAMAAQEFTRALTPLFGLAEISEQVQAIHRT